MRPGWPVIVESRTHSMKINYSGILGAILLFSPCIVLAENIVLDPSENILEFQGKIVESSCAVDLANHDFTVTLDKIGTNQFSVAGAEAAPVDFTIDLGMCTSPTRNNISVLFQGDEDPQNTQILAVRQQRDSAKGLGLAIYDMQNNLIPINRPYRLFTTNSRVFENTEKFVVRYKSTSLNVLPGRVNAEAKLLFIYQ